MIVNIFGKCSTKESYWLSKLVPYLRKIYQDQGLPTEQFTEYMEAQGIKAVGPLITIEEKWRSFCQLKWPIEEH